MQPDRMREANGMSEASRVSRLERVGRAGKEGSGRRGKRSRTKRVSKRVWDKNHGATHRVAGGVQRVWGRCAGTTVHVVEPYHAQLRGVERAECPIGLDAARDEGEDEKR